MGLIDRVFNVLFGSGNVVAETAEVFRPNAENSAQRGADLRDAAMEQFAKEFAAPTTGAFDRYVDGLNRLPRPALAFGTLGLFITAMIDPIWFAARMSGLALVPEPLWWLMGAIVSFYFGARHQVKSHNLQRSIAQTLAQAPSVVQAQGALRALSPESPGSAETSTDAATTLSALAPHSNAALQDWQMAARRT